MAHVTANGVELAWTALGPEDAPAILMTRGLGGQLSEWAAGFCEGLAQGGFRVILYDNRDIGLSQKFGSCAPTGGKVEALYTLYDMAADSAALLGALGIARAHIIGTSMGGMISQIIAARYPERTRSLVSIMSSSGERDPAEGPKEAIDALWAPWPPAHQRKAIIAKAVRDGILFSSRSHPPADADLAAGMEASMARCYCPGGVERHSAAVLATPERSAMLREIRCPSLVIHGDEDTLIPTASGERAAELIPGARFKLVKGMGHDLPQPLMPEILEAILSHCRAADGG